jgi:hypothetical protein
MGRRVSRRHEIGMTEQEGLLLLLLLVVVDVMGGLEMSRISTSHGIGACVDVVDAHQAVG